MTLRAKCESENCKPCRENTGAHLCQVKVGEHFLWHRKPTSSEKSLRIWYTWCQRVFVNQTNNSPTRGGSGPINQTAAPVLFSRSRASLWPLQRGPSPFSSITIQLCVSSIRSSDNSLVRLLWPRSAPRANSASPLLALHLQTSPVGILWTWVFIL